eukprot:scaffold13_cov241-Pinguiococcus_pyrenoidosus.AAC.34
MFSLLYGMVQQCLVRPEVILLMLGVDSAGKTTTLEALKSLFNHTASIPPNLIPPTIGLNLAKLRLPHCQVTIWDVGGQQKMRSIWQKYYQRAHGLIFVIDAADRSRFEEVARILRNVLGHEDLRHLPVLLLANKQDMEGAEAADDLRREFLAADVEEAGSGEFEERPLRGQDVCALNGDGLEEGVRWLINEALTTVRSKQAS